MRHIALTFLMLLAKQLGAASAELKVLGNQIVTVVGDCPVKLKGVNIPSLEWTNTGDGPGGNILTTVQTMITSWGCNTVRIPLNQDRWFGLGGCGATAATYQGIVDNIVNTCNARGVWVMLDLHWSDTGTWGSGSVCTSGQHDMPDNNSATFWTSVATRYANNPAVLFDLYNEPKGHTANNAGWTLWRDGGTTWTDGSYNSPGMQGMLNTVRATGARNIVIAGGIDWAYDLRGLALYNKWLTDATGNGVAYATHIYPWKPTPWDTYIPASVRSVAPVLVTEFGQNSGDPAGWTDSVINWANSYGLGFQAWCMHTAATPNLVSDWAFTPTSWFGVPAKAALLAAPGGGCAGTPTFTATRTRTRTVSPTPSPSRTATPTRTSSPTRTASPSSTRTASPSITPSSTASRTATLSATPSPSPAAPTDTPTRSSTSSATPSPTASPSSSPTRTATPLATVTSSSTVSPSSSATPTGSATPTRTATPSLTNTPLPGSTATFTSTVSPPSTPSSTPTASATPPVSSTGTGTASSTASLTPTPSSTPLNTATSTSTPPPGSSATSTSTPGAPATATPSGTATPPPGSTATFTLTATSTTAPILPAATATAADDGAPQIEAHSPWPNPGPTSLAVKLKGRADKLDLRIYSKALTCLAVIPAGPLGAGWNQIALPASLRFSLVPGIYHYSLRAGKNGALSRAVVGNLVVLP